MSDLATSWPVALRLGGEVRFDAMAGSLFWTPSIICLIEDLVVETIVGPVHVELREDGWYFRDSDPTLHAITQGLAVGLDEWSACGWLNDHHARLP